MVGTGVDGKRKAFVAEKVATFFFFYRKIHCIQTNFYINTPPTSIITLVHTYNHSFLLSRVFPLAQMTHFHLSLHFEHISSAMTSASQ